MQNAFSTVNARRELRGRASPRGVRRTQLLDRLIDHGEEGNERQPSSARAVLGERGDARLGQQLLEKVHLRVNGCEGDQDRRGQLEAAQEASDGTRVSSSAQRSVVPGGLCSNARHARLRHAGGARLAGLADDVRADVANRDRVWPKKRSKVRGRSGHARLRGAHRLRSRPTPEPSAGKLHPRRWRKPGV